MSIFHSKIAVFLYLYHTDLWAEFKSLLQNLPSNYDIFIGLCIDKDTVPIIEDIKLNNINIKNITYHENYGADIVPFLEQLKSIDISNYKYIIKLHSKKSLFGTKMHVNWRSIILNSIIGDVPTLEKNIKIFDKDNSIGMMGTEGFIGSFESVNSKKIKEICHILKIKYESIKNSNFVAGSMFIVRSDIYYKFLKKSNINKIINLIKNNKEYGKLSDKSNDSGTYSHAMERIFGYLVTANNKSIKNLTIEKTMKINDLSLAICYNNDCYIIQDVNCFGKVFNISESKCLIEWKHMQNRNSVFQLYTKKQKGKHTYYVRS